jgi:hypothetical protein
MSGLYIPYVFDNITKEYMKKTIEFQGLGKVKDIDFVEKMDKNGKIHTSAFVHFEYWCDNISAIHFQERLKNPNKEARIVYKDPWFWVCFENTGKKVIPGQRKERINLNAFSNVENDFEEEEDQTKVVLPDTIEDKFERELLEEFSCDNYDNNIDISPAEIDLILYQNKDIVLEPVEPSILTSDKKRKLTLEYVENLELLNYKLIHDLYELRGDFIMV